MTMNNTFKEIADVLAKAENIIIFPHVLADGDAIGSCVGLLKALRKIGKNVMIAIEDDIPSNLQFLAKGYTQHYRDIKGNQDLSICVDCSEKSRFEERIELFDSGNKTMCLDHHLNDEYFCDFNYIDSTAAATGEIIYDVLMALGIDIDEGIANPILAAITTDTGNFQYSNTTKKSHMIAAELIGAGAKANMISNEIYENESLAKIMLQGEILSNVELINDGKVAIARVSQALLNKVGAKLEDSEGTVAKLRSISGVEIAIMLKEKEPDEIKVSLRAKTTGNVFNIAKAFNGGGHAKASGCTIRKSLDDAYNEIKKEVERQFE